MGFQSITHQGWFHAKHNLVANPYPAHSSAWSEYQRGLMLHAAGKSWKSNPQDT